MAGTWRTSTRGTGSGASLGLTEPAAAADRDFQILCLTGPAASGVGTVTPGAGWTQRFRGTGSNGDFLVFTQTRSGTPNLSWTASGTFTGSEWEYVSVGPAINKQFTIDASAQTVVTAAATNANPPAATATGVDDESVGIGFTYGGSGTGGSTPSTGYTRRSLGVTGQKCTICSKTLTAAGSEDPGAYANGGSSNNVYSVTILLKITTVAPITQTHTRFRADNGSETGAAYSAALDADTTFPLGANLRLRFQIAAAGDPPSLVPSLLARKNGAGAYTAVPVGAQTTPGTLTLGNLSTNLASTTTSIAPAYPTGYNANSALVVVLMQKPTTANGGGCSTPSGWTLQCSKTGANDGDTGGYGSTTGADVGNMNLFVFTKDTVTGAETGSVTFTLTDNNITQARMFSVDCADINTLSYSASVGKDTAAGNINLTTDAGVTIQAGDFLVFGQAIPTDVSTPSQFSAEAITQSGTTFGAVNEIFEFDSASGNQLGGWMANVLATAGSGSTAPTITATAGGTTTNTRGPGFVLRIRATSVVWPLYIAPSSNVASGGEATTAQLTPLPTDYVFRVTFDENTGNAAAVTGGVLTGQQLVRFVSGAPSGNFTWRTGALGSAVAFASGDYGDYGGDFMAALFAAGRTTIYRTHTVSVGVMWAGGPGSDAVVVGNTSTAGYAPYIDQTNIYYSTGGTNFVTVAHGGLSPDETWMRFSIVRSGTSVTFYKNGVQIGTTQTLASNDDLHLQAVGAYAGGGFFLTGAVDDLRVYDRALTATEIATSYREFTGGAFTTGRMWDDENGVDAIDLGNNGYTELEWSLAAQAPAVNTDFYEFRVYVAGVPLDTYTVTPKWTIGGLVLTASPGAITLTGTAAVAKTARLIQAATGSVLVTGTAAVPKVSRRTVASPGSVLVSGTAATVKSARAIAADAGFVTIAGTAALPKVARVTLATPGSVLVSGVAAGLAHGRILTATSGSVVVSGTAAAFPWSRVFHVDPGSVALTGTPAIVKLARTFSLDPGSVVVLGTDAGLVYGYVLDASTGEILVTGTPVNLRLHGGVEVDIHNTTIVALTPTRTVGRVTPTRSTGAVSPTRSTRAI